MEQESYLIRGVGGTDDSESALRFVAGSSPATGALIWLKEALYTRHQVKLGVELITGNESYPKHKRRSVDATVVSESVLRYSGNFSVASSSPSPTPWPDGGRPESLRSPYCGTAIQSCPQQGDLKFSGPPSIQDTDGEATERSTENVKAVLLFAVPPTPPKVCQPENEFD
ncbi:hypothetical protein PoB_004861100 [Plakobranchus ocellatus]|uniref:Uncharacterized protein n=1 Tax=Plakobranchus ocellatus TaxID=259542 RepID=A0AAV4BFJ9_9GAST|nr:hypothetical protein PoB_004861100 [Plakobranchus ocellatus]